MTTHDAALERISRAQTALREAGDLWDGADCSSIERCNQLLELSAAALHEFRDAVVLGTVTPTAQIRSTVVGIKNQIQQLTRIVDAASTFFQGLAVYAGARCDTYNAAGQIQHDGLIAGARES